MNPPRLLCFGLILFVGTQAGVVGVNAGLPPDSERVELRTFPSEAPLGKFDGHGKLLYQELYEDEGPADWHNTFTYYPRGSQKGYRLQRNIRSINVFLAAEIRRPRTVRTFLKGHLGHFLVDNFGDDGTTSVGFATTIIEAGNVDESYGSDPNPYARVPAATRARVKAHIERYVQSAQPVVNGNHWTLDINVLINDGAVEHWVAKGRVKPLQIDSFLTEPKEPAGTFYPMTAYH